MPDADPNPLDPTLTPDQADAIDKLLADGLEDLPADDLSQAQKLLALLSTPLKDEDPSLVDVTIMRGQRAKQDLAEPVLLDADREALDAWIMAGHDCSRTPASLHSRAQQHQNLASLTQCPIDAEADDGLIERTIELARQSSQTESFVAADYRPTPSWSMRDLVSLAAMLLLASAVILPVLSNVRSNATQLACFNNLAAVGNAVGVYAGANRSSLPVATAGFSGTWINVGGKPEESNSANLYTLVRKGYTPLDKLACPGNPQSPTHERTPGAYDWRNIDEISYSYSIMAGRGMTLSQPGRTTKLVIATDRSPVILRVVRGEAIVPEANSPNHRGQGQHALFADGSSAWLGSPVLESGDNIWLPRPIEQAIREARSRLGLIKGDEVPQSVNDAFVGP